MSIKILKRKLYKKEIVDIGSNEKLSRERENFDYYSSNHVNTTTNIRLIQGHLNVEKLKEQALKVLQPALTEYQNYILANIWKEDMRTVRDTRIDILPIAGTITAHKPGVIFYQGENRESALARNGLMPFVAIARRNDSHSFSTMQYLLESISGTITHGIWTDTALPLDNGTETGVQVIRDMVADYYTALLTNVLTLTELYEKSESDSDLEMLLTELKQAIWFLIDHQMRKNLDSFIADISMVYTRRLAEPGFYRGIWERYQTEAQNSRLGDHIDWINYYLEFDGIRATDQRRLFDSAIVSDGSLTLEMRPHNLEVARKPINLDGISGDLDVFNVRSRFLKQHLSVSIAEIPKELGRGFDLVKEAGQDFNIERVTLQDQDLTWYGAEPQVMMADIMYKNLFVTASEVKNIKKLMTRQHPFITQIEMEVENSNPEEEGEISLNGPILILPNDLYLEGTYEPYVTEYVEPAEAKAPDFESTGMGILPVNQLEKYNLQADMIVGEVTASKPIEVSSLVS